MNPANIPNVTNKFVENFHALTPWLPEDNKPEFLTSDITRRDGMQALPWYHHWTAEQHAEMVKKIAKMGIPHMELGFPVVDGDPETKDVTKIIELTGGTRMALFALVRILDNDINVAKKVLSGASFKGLHTFIGISDEHLQAMGKTEEWVVQRVGESVTATREAGFMSEFSPEDATRAWIAKNTHVNRQRLLRVMGAAVDAGAQTINIPDTLGYADMKEHTDLFKWARKNFPDVILSTHTHNDRQLAIANALAVVQAGYAHRVEGTIHGIGERKGNLDWPAFLGTMRSRALHDVRTGRKSVYVNKYEDLLPEDTNFDDLLEFFESVSGIDRSLVDTLSFEGNVNRSGVHQQKSAKMKRSYVWFDDKAHGMKDRPLFDINPLSGNAGIQSILFSMGIDIAHRNPSSAESKEDKKEALDDFIKLNNITKLCRMIFNQGSDNDSIMKEFGSFGIKKEDLDYINTRCEKIRNQAWTLKNNKHNVKRWLNETRQIVMDALFILYPKYEFGPYHLDSYSFGGGADGVKDGKSWGEVVVNGNTHHKEANGPVEATITALREAFHTTGIEYSPKDVTTIKGRQNGNGERGIAEIHATVSNEENSINIIARHSSTVRAHIIAYMRGINQLAVLKEYKKSRKKAEIA